MRVKKWWSSYGRRFWSLGGITVVSRSRGGGAVGLLTVVDLRLQVRPRQLAGQARRLRQRWVDGVIGQAIGFHSIVQDREFGDAKQ